MCRQIPNIPNQSLPSIREGMSREEVINRLDLLLQDPQLRNEIERVSFFIFVDYDDVVIIYYDGRPSRVVNGYFF